MQKSSSHCNLQVKCSMDEPIELLMDKLSTKSTDLYIFWQNYDQLYRQYNEKNNQNIILREEVEHLKRALNSPKQIETRTVEDPYLRQKLNDSERNIERLRDEIDKVKGMNFELVSERTRTMEELETKNNFILQLKEENNIQRENISSILIKMKQAQTELAGYTKVFEQLQEKDAMIAKILEKEKELQIEIEEKDDEIFELDRNRKEMKSKFEKIIKESMQNAKETVINNLPSPYKSFRT